MLTSNINLERELGFGVVVMRKDKVMEDYLVLRKKVEMYY